MPLKRTPPASPGKGAKRSIAPNIIASAPTTPAPTTAYATNPMEHSCAAVPPQNPQIQKLFKSKHCSSEPNLFVPERKRKLSEIDDDKLDKIMADMNKMMLDFKQEQKKSSDKIDKWCSAAEDMKSSVDFLAQKYDALAEQCKTLQKERAEDRQLIKALEEKIESFERSSRASCLEIRNIPAAVSETKPALLETLINTGKVLNVPIQHTDVKDIFRINTKVPSNKTIIVELGSVLLKEKVISMFRNYNKSGSRLTTEHLKINGPAKPIFISENLTHKMKRLFYLARDCAKINDFKFCWVAHGKILIRKREGGQLFRIDSENDLCKLTNNK